MTKIFQVDSSCVKVLNQHQIIMALQNEMQNRGRMHSMTYSLKSTIKCEKNRNQFLTLQ